MPLPIYSYSRDVDAHLMTADPQFQYDPREHKLMNPIHPIWDHRNIRVAALDVTDDDALLEFYNRKPADSIMTKTAYERMRPAFQLASLMLKASEPFFSRIRCAKIGPKKHRRFEETAGDAGAFCMVGELDRNYVASPADTETCRRMWTELGSGRCTTIFRNDACPDPWEVEQYHGSTTYVDVHTTLSRQTGDEADAERLIFTDVEVRFWEFFRIDQSSNPFRRATPQARNRYWLDLAALLLHELTHAVWMDRDRAGAGEALYSHRHPEVEIGFEWETYFFGGIVRDIHGPLRSAQHTGVTWYSDQYIATFAGDLDKFVFDRHCGIKAASVNQFFSPKRWDAHWRAVKGTARPAAVAVALASPKKHQGITKRRPSPAAKREQQRSPTLLNDGRFVLELTPHHVVGLFSAEETKFGSTFKYWLDEFRNGQDYLAVTVDEFLQSQQTWDRFWNADAA